MKVAGRGGGYIKYQTRVKAAHQNVNELIENKPYINICFVRFDKKNVYIKLETKSLCRINDYLHTFIDNFLTDDLIWPLSLQSQLKKDTKCQFSKYSKKNCMAVKYWVIVLMWPLTTFEIIYNSTKCLHLKCLYLCNVL